MKLIYRYICREVLSHSLVGLAVFTFVFFVPQLVRLMDLVVRNWRDAGTTLLLVACAFPGVLAFSLPIAVLVGTLIALGRLGADSEIVALNSVGFSRRRLLVPIGLFALLAGLLTLGNTLWLVPRALGELDHLQSRLLASQTSFEVEPRVFQEEFNHLLLYVEDASASGRSWRRVFLARTDAGGASQITLAQSALLVPRRHADTLQLHLQNGATYSYDPSQPSSSPWSTFASSDWTLSLAGAERSPDKLTPQRESLGQLFATQGTDWREARVELQRRFAFPAACLVFALLALAVGGRPRQAGRALGFVLTLVLLAGYYLVFVVGVGKARQGALPPWLGVWLADIVCFLAGIALFAGIDRVRGATWYEGASDWLARLRRGRPERAGSARAVASSGAPPVGRSARFPLIMDLYVLRGLAFYFVISLAGFVLLIEIFTFFELLDDIARHHAPILVVAGYFFYLAPLLLYQLTPLAALVGTLATLAVMNKYNEVTAFKASGISLYRVSVPLILAGLLLAAGLFAMDATLLPIANRKQDALRNQIKGLPAQTFFQSRLRWIFGRGDKIYNYELYDPDQQLFAGLNVFEIDPASFSLHRRIFARQAKWEPVLGTWVLEQGWVRNFHDEAVVGYQAFTVASFPELTEPPGYFRREVLPSYQMDWRQLGRYIAQMQHAGFDVSRLSVEWQRKFAFPLLAGIIILIGIPFPFLAGARGAVGGLAVGVGIGIVYWATADLFEAMGAVGQLPPVVAGWAPDAIFLFLGLYFFLKMPT